MSSDARVPESAPHDPPPPADLAGRAPAPDWAAALDDDTRPVAAAKGWKSPADAVRSYAHLERQLGADKIAVPGQDASAEDWAELYDKLGRPAKPEEYDLGGFERPDGVPWSEDAEKAMLAEMHAAGLNGRQAERLLSRYAAMQGDGYRNAAKVAEASAARAETELRREWGGDFEARISLANRALRAAFGQNMAAARALKLADGSFWGDHPAVVRAFARLGGGMAEDRFVDGRGGRFAMTPDDARAEIARMHGDAGTLNILTDKGHPEYEATVSKRTRLFEIAYPDG